MVLNDTIAYYALLAHVSEEERDATIRDATLVCALDKRMYVQYRSARVKNTLIGHDPICYNDIEVAPLDGIHPVALLIHLMTTLGDSDCVTVDEARRCTTTRDPTFFVQLDDARGGRVVYGYGAFQRSFLYEPRVWAAHRDALLKRFETPNEK